MSSIENIIHLIPASSFSYEELTEAYNQTRVDYIVPMPMNAAKLREYVEIYDVDIDASTVAVDGNEILGLAMIAFRPGRAWITRLGVIRSNRRQKTGWTLVTDLIAKARQKRVDSIIIEVIKNNAPAHALFTKKGFVHTRDLLVLRRPPVPLNIETLPVAEIKPFQPEQIGELLARRRSRSSWIDNKNSLLKAGNLRAFKATLPDGSWGWLVYQEALFQLGRVVIQTEVGDPIAVGRALLHHLHATHPFEDTKTENLPANDPHWPVFKELGYLITFLRNEMTLTLE